jgi:carbon-monoxide dehydrogenase large subunit
VRVVLGDTDRGDGFGSAGSRSLFTGGSALRGRREGTWSRRANAGGARAGGQRPGPAVRRRALPVRGTDLSIGLFEIAGKQPEQRIFLESTTAVAGPSWPNGCHVTEVEVDPSTGEVRVVAYSSVNDIGRVVNPTIVRGQLDGGAVQGWARR